MGAIRDIFGKEPEQVDLSDIQNLITERREEARNLEYKSPGILKKPVDLSSWVSALLNADGGLIALGVCEDAPSNKNKVTAKIYPSKIEFVSKDYNKERIEQLVFSNLHSSIKPDIRIYPIRDSNDPNQAVYLIEIPQGDNPPYQAGDNKYYRRLNVTKYAMSHTEIADFFGRRRKPRLIINSEITSVNIEESWFELRVLIINEGNVVAKHARVIVSFINLEILKMVKGVSTRIDELRNNIPTLQWNEEQGVIYPGPTRTRIWDIRLKPKEDAQEGIVGWDTIAEDQETIKMFSKVDIVGLKKLEDVLKTGIKIPIPLRNITEQELLIATIEQASKLLPTPH